MAEKRDKAGIGFIGFGGIQVCNDTSYIIVRVVVSTTVQ